jgi:S-disulfanyl-L-cysteine oxidoreductase SoxD
MQNSKIQMQIPRSKMQVALRSAFIFGFCILHFELPVQAQGPTYGLGRPAGDAEIRKYDRFIPPSGANLPPGSGTAEKGKAIYAAQCARCHGATGREGPEEVLAGGIGSLTSPKPQKTVGSYWPYATTLWDYVNRAMPFDRPGMLPPDDVYSVVAYVLQLNGIVSPNDVVDAKNLPAIRMPNRDGFVPDGRPDTGKRNSQISNSQRPRPPLSR